ncbi:MAG: plasmid maintenance system killer [Candidatus Magasanikbacteria bacterium CG_4_9_14_0_2_um_filter_42_11]|uniref:Plasmid maintenance system killer n=1 Tax=Candidatus Magasanikbacteria bacterium CG_4_9_14_0_2_um_filter_42_11 TaxID=1974643 RepID=A0A2M8FAP4_9BACT|nr:MAG: plasmid maintenance system killer [Candidatus Magasanikbacteria bacterium CG10_big_fil_rev_8_21_14_0_10_43_9]PIY92638.1 MAG: plasmid maintenance system killer [Candidatus Magasanikbacteria bacterium CG_4_10_14_0_8_um_filter_42_12]PJC52739.1 MAG: plasmid maintenance system killer [Candidatus Magasanikbacteria bacterium CG_4_9_14_0_2_um_filter_42_11]
MILSFHDKETEKIWLQEYSRKLPRGIQQIALRKLFMIHRAKHIQDLRVPPGNRLERLQGDRNGQYSIRINEKYRICFRWLDGDAHHVEIVDYH